MSSPRTGSAQVFTQVGTVGPNTTSFRDAGLQAAKSYHYCVLGCNENGCSAPSSLSPDAATHPVLVITTTQLPGGVIDTPYGTALGATLGIGAVTWTLSSGALPKGSRCHQRGPSPALRPARPLRFPSSKRRVADRRHQRRSRLPSVGPSSSSRVRFPTEWSERRTARY